MSKKAPIDSIKGAKVPKQRVLSVGDEVPTQGYSAVKNDDFDPL